jgi:bifunctional pyridoxal-dependent enzyme with beta-cystathionase and maltose regulon repressor activities
LKGAKVNSEFKVPSNLLEFIKNNNQETVHEVLFAFSKFWEIDMEKLNHFIQEEDIKQPSMENPTFL